MIEPDHNPGSGLHPGSWPGPSCGGNSLPGLNASPVGWLVSAAPAEQPKRADYHVALPGNRRTPRPVVGDEGVQVQAADLRRGRREGFEPPTARSEDIPRSVGVKQRVVGVRARR